VATATTAAMAARATWSWKIRRFPPNCSTSPFERLRRDLLSRFYFSQSWHNWHRLTEDPGSISQFLRSQSCDFCIYNYNASVVVAYSVFQSRWKYFCFQNALCYSWRCNSKS
jgi:hypothetical protein